MRYENLMTTLLDALAELAGRAMAARKGQSMVEYAILGALIAVVAVGAVAALGTAISGKFTEITGALGGG